MGPTTREVKLRIEREIPVPLPGSGGPYMLPPGDYVGYLHETDKASGDERQIDNAMLCLDDAAIIKKLGLAERARPINFEVKRLIDSGAIKIVDD